MANPDRFLLYVIYCKYNERLRTYVGITNNLSRRLRKHRGEIKGGAKYTTKLAEDGGKWVLGGTLHGFKDHQEALQIEWAVQHPHLSVLLKKRDYNTPAKLGKTLSNLFFVCNNTKDKTHLSAHLHCVPQRILERLLEEYPKGFNFVPEERVLEGSFVPKLTTKKEKTPAVPSLTIEPRDRSPERKNASDPGKPKKIAPRKTAAVPGQPKSRMQSLLEKCKAEADRSMADYLGFANEQRSFEVVVIE
jgi:predicted GIY-YIG superfamily endonuclease